MFNQEKHSYLYVPCYVRDLSRIWETAIHLGERLHYKKGQTFALGDDGNHFGYIQSGVTCHLILDDDGIKDEIRFFLGPHTLLRDIFVSAGFGAYQSTHKCLTEVTLFRFEKSLLGNKDFLAQHAPLVQNLIFSISAKSISLQFFSNILKRNSNAQKIAIYLYGFYLLNRKRLSFTPPFSQYYLAELLGISKLTVNRIISAWKEAGIIGGYTKNNIRILDVERLAALRHK